MDSESRNNVLALLARLLDTEREAILAANRLDIAACTADDQVIVDRLRVDQKKIEAMIASVESVAVAADPVGRLLYSHIRENGLRIENRTVPFGTILIIYEARPDVTIEAAAIALKAGNRILLKGGKEARHTNSALVDLWHQALYKSGISTDAVRYLDISRDETQRLIAERSEKFDLVIPRGGDALIDFVVKNSTVPVVVSGRGNNFLYVHSEADRQMAIDIAVNGKQRLSVCNALDKIVIDKGLAEREAFIVDLAAALRSEGIEVLGDEAVASVAQGVDRVADESVWYEEFLSAKIVLGEVDGIDRAIDKINKYSGGHSATIVTTNNEAAERFMAEVDAAAVYHNASTRFTDGGQFGLGAEIAISTQKLHFRGPLGSEHLLTNKWFVYGDGQVRV
jgi:glutamate-5-semialdehyde dehydrogenase